MYQAFAPLYDRLMSDVDYPDWSENLLKLIAQEAPGPQTVFDAACGTGNFTIPFALAGHKVTGCDISQPMLEQAAEKARKRGLNIPFVCQDMRRLELHKPCTVVNSSCDGVNYLSSPVDVKRFFSTAGKALVPGGLILFDISSQYKLERVLGDNTFGYDDGSVAYLWRNAYDPRSRLVEMRLSFFVKEGEMYRRSTERHVQRAHDTEELKGWLEGEGFGQVRVLDGESFGPPREDSHRLQFLARKL